MKKLNKIFFTTDNGGLSETSANHIANLAKELVKKHNLALKSLNFVEKTAGVLGQDTQSVIEAGSDREMLNSIPQRLEEIGKANSLIAWLREAIKAKNTFLENVKYATIEDCCEWEGMDGIHVDPNDALKRIKDYQDKISKIDALERKIANQVTTPDPAITEEEAVGKWSEHEQSDYKSLVSTVSTLEVIDEHLNALIASIMDAESEVKKPQEQNNGTSIYRFERPTVTVEQVEEKLKVIRLQLAEARDRLYAYQEKIEAEIKADRLQKEKEAAARENQLELDKQALEVLKNEKEHHLSMTRLHKSERNNLLYTYRIEKAKEIGSLKIIIPASLREIYNKVAALGN